MVDELLAFLPLQLDILRIAFACDTLRRDRQKPIPSFRVDLAENLSRAQ